MTDREICSSYRGAKHKAQQIQILAELNSTDSLGIIRILVCGGEELPGSVASKLYRRLDSLEGQILELEREYMAVADALKGEG